MPRPEITTAGEPLYWSYANLAMAHAAVFEHWTKVLGNERLTGALLDRITHRVHIIEANGESYRLRDARRRAKRKRGKAQ